MSATRNKITLAVAFAPIIGKLDGLRVAMRIGGSRDVAADVLAEVIAEIEAALDAERAAAEPEACAGCAYGHSYSDWKQHAVGCPKRAAEPEAKACPCGATNNLSHAPGCASYGR